MLWNIAEKKNIKRGLVVGRWGHGRRGFIVGRCGSCDDLMLLMGEGQVFRLIISIVCPWYYWSWSCLLSANPWKGKGSVHSEWWFFPFLPFPLPSFSPLLSTLSPSIPPPLGTKKIVQVVTHFVMAASCRHSSRYYLGI